ncbi:MAG: hypothetical protein LBJ71_04020, partial [Holosporaceae bacterium]|nr:hypothetical protein [Holosporaceae bacterium]
MKFAGHEMANILQNVSQNRASKRITKTDIRHAVAAVYLSVYSAKTMYTTSESHSPMGYTSNGHLYCVKGVENGNASVIWCIRWHSAVDSPSPAKISMQDRDPYERTIVNMGSGVKPSSIYPDLHIQEGETKILVEISFHYGSYFTDGRTCADVPAKTAFGFFVLEPLWRRRNVYFNTVVIFT